MTSAVNKIASIATKGLKRMEKGVDTIRDSDSIVRRLTEELAENSELAKVIAKSIDQQITGLNYISNATGEFTAAIKSNREISESVAAGSRKLGESIGKMLENVENWKTPEFYSGEISRGNRGGKEA